MARVRKPVRRLVKRVKRTKPIDRETGLQMTPRSIDGVHGAQLRQCRSITKEDRKHLDKQTDRGREARVRLVLAKANVDFERYLADHAAAMFRREIDLRMFVHRLRQGLQRVLDSLERDFHGMGHL